MADKEYKVQSLDSYDAPKVISAIETFHTHCSAFDDVSVQILSVKNDLQRVWKGIAADAFVEKFEVVYGQVTDIGAALYDIYNALLDAQDAFYQADDSLQQQMLQAEHNKQNSGGKGSSSSSGDLLDVGQHNTPEHYVPNVALPPMTPQPVLQSTMGDSYNPAFFYENFQQMPVVGHSVPSPVAVQMLYDSMNVKEVISHNVADAANKVFEYETKGLLDMQEHDVPDAYVPDPVFEQMAPKEVVPHGTPDPYRPEFAYDAMNPVNVGSHDVPDAQRPGFGYDGMNPLDVGQHDTPDAAQTGIGYEAMAPKDVAPHGTEDARAVEFGYEAMAPKDVAPHGTEDARAVEFGYEAMAPKDVVSHDVGEAQVPVLDDYAGMAPKEVTPHNVPDPYRPEFIYAGMAPLDVPTSTIGETYFYTFLDMPATRRARLYSSLSVAVMSELTKGMIHGTDLATVKLNMGKLMVDMLAPSSALQGAERERLAVQMGEQVFEAICGTPDGGAIDAVNSLLQHPNAWTKDNVNAAVANIMDDAAIPGSDMAVFFKDALACDGITQSDLVPVPKGDMPISVQPIRVGKIAPAHEPQNFKYIQPIGANQMLGTAGTEGMDASGLADGMKHVADYSMKMTTVRVLSEPKVNAHNLDVDVAAFNKPVATCVPSLTETKVDCSGDSITWSLTESAKDPVQNNAIMQFAADPVAASKNNAVSATLKGAAQSSIKVTPITINGMGARFA